MSWYGWTTEQREGWKRAYRAGESVQLPVSDHERGECDFCDMLRALMAEADDEQATGERGPTQWPEGTRAQVIVTDPLGVALYVSDAMPLGDGDVVEFRLPQVTVSR